MKKKSKLNQNRSQLESGVELELGRTCSTGLARPGRYPLDVDVDVGGYAKPETATCPPLSVTRNPQ